MTVRLADMRDIAGLTVRYRPFPAIQYPGRETPGDGPRMLRKVPSIVLVAMALGWQLLPARAQHAQFQVYGSEQGLESLAVRGVGEDELGFLWAATEAGLYRFDGTEFKAAGAEAGAPEEPVTRLFRSSTGHLWAIAAQSLLYEDKGRFHSIPVKGLAETPIRLNQIGELDGGEIVVRTGEGFSSVHLQKKGNGQAEWVAEDFADAHPGFPRDAHVNTMVQTRGGIWMGCDAGLCRWLAGRLIREGKEDGVPRDSYRTLLQTSNGDVWARGQSHMLRLSPGSSRWSDVTGQLVKAGTCLPGEEYRHFDSRRLACIHRARRDVGRGDFRDLCRSNRRGLAGAARRRSRAVERVRTF